MTTMWQPQKGEWCWFYDDSMITHNIPPYLAQFSASVTLGSGKIIHQCIERLPNGYRAADNIEPYLSTLPSYIGANNESNKDTTRNAICT